MDIFLNNKLKTSHNPKCRYLNLLLTVKFCTPAEYDSYFTQLLILVKWHCLGSKLIHFMPLTSFTNTWKDQSLEAWIAVITVYIAKR